MAVDDGLQVDLADAFQHADEEGVDRHQRAGVRGLDVAVAELRAEPLEEPGLLGRELDRPLGRGLLQPQQPLVFRQQVVPAPDPAHPAGADLQAAQGQLVGDPHRAVGRVRQGMVEDRRLDLGGDPVRVRVPRPLHLVDQAGGTVGLVVAADLVELLPAVADQLAGPADVAEILRQLEQAELAPCYPLIRGHVDLLAGTCWRVATPAVAPQERHGHAPPSGGTKPEPVRSISSQHSLACPRWRAVPGKGLPPRCGPKSSRAMASR